MTRNGVLADWEVHEGRERVSIFSQPKDGGGGRRGLLVVLVVLLAVVAVGVVLWWLARRPGEPRRGPLAAPRADASPSPRAPKSTPAPTTRATPRAEPRPERASAPTLHVDADVPGASVFLDRRFLGTTPVVTRDFEPGPHRLNVSAEGYEMYGETVELAAGPNEVTVRFKEVRLDERVDVEHRHGLGSCRGRLLATTAGLRYEADKQDDSFQATFASLEPLQVDYLERNLRVKQRNGKTWNFTAPDAATLLAFQRAVEKARERM